MLTSFPSSLFILCGGQSGEHQVSLASARSVIAALKGDNSLHVELAVLSLDGKLILKQDAWNYLEYGQVPTQTHDLSALTVAEETIVFPLLHGPFGEDGRVQGWLDMLQVPYIGSSVRASAVAMDKLTMKAVFAQYELPQVAYQQVLAQDLQDLASLYTRLELLDIPLFVKPANLGSSVGISKVKAMNDLDSALKEAARYDDRIIVEKGLEGVRELEVAVLGNSSGVTTPRTSVVGEIIHQSELYDYATKYEDGKAQLSIPANIPDDVAKQCQTMALAAYTALGCDGLSRVDFFLDTQGKIWLNEINTMPGFTDTSMYPRLWKATGMSYVELIHALIALARERCNL